VSLGAMDKRFIREANVGVGIVPLYRRGHKLDPAAGMRVSSIGLTFVSLNSSNPNRRLEWERKIASDIRTWAGVTASTRGSASGGTV